MKAIAKLKDDARRHEQKEEWEKAIHAYLQVLHLADQGDSIELDLPLYNRVGDIYVRLGRERDAVKYYEQAADRYAEAGLYNNAIALCNKALRYDEGRVELLKKLGSFSASQGFFTDARRWYLEYAEKSIRLGAVDEAFNALSDLAQVSDEPEVRELLARQLRDHGRKDRALDEYKRAYAMRVAAGHDAAAQALLKEIGALDPAADVNTIGTAAVADYQPPVRHRADELPGFADHVEQVRGEMPPVEVAPEPLPTLDEPASFTAHAAPQEVVDELPTLAEFEPDTVDELPTLADFAPDTVDELPAFADFEPDTVDELPTLADSEPDVVDELPAPADFEQDIVDELPALADFEQDVVDGLPVPADFEQDVVDELPTLAEFEPDMVDELPTLADFEQDMVDELPTFAEFEPETPQAADDFARAMLFDEPETFTGPDLVEGALPLDAAAQEDPASEAAAESDVAFEPHDPGTETPFSIAPIEVEEEPELIDLKSLSSLSGLEPSHPEGSSLDADTHDMYDGLDALPGLEGLQADAALHGLDGLDLRALDIGEIEQEERSLAGTPLPFDIEDHDVTETPASDEQASQAEHELEFWTQPKFSPSQYAPPTEDLWRIDEEPPAASAEQRPTEEPAEEQLVAGDEAAADEMGTFDEEEPALDTLTTWSAGPEAFEIESPVEPPPAIEEQIFEEQAAVYGEDTPAASVDEPEATVLPDVAASEDLLAFRYDVEFDDEEPQPEPESIAEWSSFTGEEWPGFEAPAPQALPFSFDEPEATVAEPAAEEVGMAAAPVVEFEPAPELTSQFDRAEPSEPEPEVYAPPVMEAPESTEPVAGPEPSPEPPSEPPPAPPEPQPAVYGAPPAGKPDREYVDLAAMFAEDEEEVPDSTRFVVAERPPTGDEERDFADMLQQFKQKVAETIPREDAGSHYDLGLAFKEMGLIDEAIGEFQTALRSGQEKLKVYEELGSCFLMKQQYGVAVTVLNRAQQMPHSDESELLGVYYNLGRAHEEMGQRAEARAAFEKIVSIDISFQDTNARLARL